MANGIDSIYSPSDASRMLLELRVAHEKAEEERLEARDKKIKGGMKIGGKAWEMWSGQQNLIAQEFMQGGKAKWDPKYTESNFIKRSLTPARKRVLLPDEAGKFVNPERPEGLVSKAFDKTSELGRSFISDVSDLGGAAKAKASDIGGGIKTGASKIGKRIDAISPKGTEHDWQKLKRGDELRALGEYKATPGVDVMSKDFDFEKVVPKQVVSEPRLHEMPKIMKQSPRFTGGTGGPTPKVAPTEGVLDAAGKTGSSALSTAGKVAGVAGSAWSAYNLAKDWGKMDKTEKTMGIAGTALGAAALIPSPLSPFLGAASMGISLLDAFRR